MTAVTTEQLGASGYDRRVPRLRHTLLVVAAGLAFLLPAAAADAKPTRCKSADLRYPFMPGGAKTSHRVAKTWMKRFEANLRHGHVKLPRHVSGFTFETLPATEAQSYRERGRKGAKTIRFLYRVPNG
jgi:hypothetical protein